MATTPTHSEPVKLLRMQQVMDRTGLKRAKLYQLINRDEFPKPLKINKCALWPDYVVDQWIADVIKAGGI